MSDVPEYQGKGKAIHVSDTSFTVLPTGPTNPNPVYKGQSPAIMASEGSPPQWPDRMVTGPVPQQAVYYGRSQAIHVFGTDVVVITPPPPVKSCKCCAEQSGGITDTFQRDLDPGWGTSDAGIAWADSGAGGAPNVYTVPPRGFGEIITTGNIFSEELVVDMAECHATVQFQTDRVEADVPSSGPFSREITVAGVTVTGPSTTVGAVEIVLHREPVTIGGATSTLVRLFKSASAVTEDYTCPVVIDNFVSTYNLKVEFVPGQPVRGKIWIDGDAEPGSWIEMTVNLPSQTYTSFLLGNASQFSNVTTDYQNLDITEVPAAGGSSGAVGDCVDSVTHLRFDDFGRTVASGWGDASSGPTYSMAGDGSSGVVPGAGYLLPNTTPMVATVDGPVSSGTDFTCTVKLFIFDDIVSAVFIFGGLNFSWHRSVSFSTAPWQDEIRLWDGFGSELRAFVGTNPDSFWHAAAGAGTSNWGFLKVDRFGQHVRAKIWGDIHAEPGWMLEGDLEDFTVLTTDEVSASPVGTSGEVDYAYIDFDTVTGCAECEDPNNPGSQLPPFTPGYMPTFRKQIGDPTTNLDSFICTLESAAMVLEWHTRGAVKVWGGELIPWCGKTEAQIAATGSNLDNARIAWLHYDQILDVRSGQTFADFIVALQEGRAAILQGDYSVFTNAEKCQDNFEGFHAVSVYPYQVSDRLLEGDPLCSDFTGIRVSSLQAYAETFGVAVFGVTSPQKILFAVSRPWTP